MDSRGIHKFHNSLFRRLLGTSACGAAALAVVLAAGCGSHTQAAGASHRSAPATARAALPPAQALRLAAEQEQHVTSFTGTLTMRLSGMRGSTVTGAMRARLKPEPAYYLAATFARPGRAPRTMREVITGHTLYLNSGQMFTQRFGKPWVKVPAGPLHKLPSLNFGPVNWSGPRLGQAGTGPLGEDAMLTAATDVRVTGTQLVAGVQTTRYSGIYQLPLKTAGIHGKKQRLERRLMRDLGFGRMRLTACIDGRHQLRELSLRGNLGPERMTVTVIYTGLNEPVAIPVPPPGQVAEIPPGMPGSTLG
ncbi:MAG TPA: hypothetical protein VH641_16055 [Streptosporangiaceae bacterium]|jgi:hypothetical protein